MHAEPFTGREAVLLHAAGRSINPPVTAPTWFWIVSPVLLLAAAAVVLLVRRALTAPATTEGIDVERLRVETLSAIRRAVAQAGPDEPAARVAAAEVSRRVRHFLALVSGQDLDHTTAAQWRRAARREPELGPAVELLVALDTGVHAPGPAPDLLQLAARAEEVVSSWR